MYRLNEQGTWDDRGEGFLTIQHLEVSSLTSSSVLAVNGSGIKMADADMKYARTLLCLHIWGRDVARDSQSGRGQEMEVGHTSLQLWGTNIIICAFSTLYVQ